MKEPSILILAGEASGDYHAAAMVKDLKQLCPGIRFSGIGGDKLAQAGMELFHHYREINTIGLNLGMGCLLYTSPSPRDRQKSRMPSSA